MTFQPPFRTQIFGELASFVEYQDVVELFAQAWIFDQLDKKWGRDFTPLQDLCSKGKNKIENTLCSITHQHFMTHYVCCLITNCWIKALGSKLGYICLVTSGYITYVFFKYLDRRKISED